MSRKLVLIILIILASGFIASLMSGLLTQDLTHGRIGASKTGYGFPFSWLEKVTIVYPGNPTEYNLSPSGLLMDFVFWTLIMGGLIAVVFRWLKPENNSSFLNLTPVY